MLDARDGTVAKEATRGSHLDLNEMFIRPRDGEARVLPLFPYIEQGEMVASWLDEILSGGVGCSPGRVESQLGARGQRGERCQTHPPTSSA